MTTVAVLGTGRMGCAMARRLVDAGHIVRLWNRSQSTAQALASELQCTSWPTVAEAVDTAEVVLSVLAGPDATSAVLLDPRTLEALGPDTVVCDMGTSGAQATAEIAARYEQLSKHFVDSPVSGSVPSVMSGSLLVMAGGTPGDVARVTPVLLAFAKRVAHVGPTGTGQSLKLAINLVVHSLNSAVSEALALAAASGIAPEDAYGVLLDSSSAAPYVAYKQEAFLALTSPVAMSLDLVARDLQLIREVAAQAELPLLTLDAVAEEVDRARQAGFGPTDMADVNRFLRGEQAPARPRS